MYSNATWTNSSAGCFTLLFFHDNYLMLLFNSHFYVYPFKVYWKFLNRRKEFSLFFFLILSVCVVQTLANLNVAQAMYRVAECTFGNTTSEEHCARWRKDIKCTSRPPVNPGGALHPRGGNTCTLEGRCVYLQLHCVPLEISCKKVHVVRGFFSQMISRFSETQPIWTVSYLCITIYLFVLFSVLFCFVYFLLLALPTTFLPSARYLLLYY